MNTKEQRLSNEIDRCQIFLKEASKDLSFFGAEGSSEAFSEGTLVNIFLTNVGPMLKAATIIRIYSQVLKVLQRDGVDATKSYLEERIFRAARNPLRSTDPLSNYQNTLELEYLAEALDIIKHH